MDEDVPGRGAPASGVPDAATIRRALGECMTLADIDDAMDWPEGTARRRRWRDPAAGGLPPADAELGGVPLWFRATVSRWRAELPGRRADAGTDSTPPGPEAEAPPEPETHPERETRPQRPAEPEADAEPDAEAEGQPESEGDAVPDARSGTTLHSGFQLDEGQDVLAYVHGSWQPAVVRSRARRTVVVDYQVHPGALGARRQRVAIDRIRQDR
ncbi:hypothetical protein [Pseudonocardia kunmingensis]|uniref:hypothetical protein n=1 Tax=Pseudonocardia kunmingensis TaxID=630975 RepID=UPI0014796200|nr:hypothetical protein [Pseudonocardia kunmingensis]